MSSPAACADLAAPSLNTDGGDVAERSLATFADGRPRYKVLASGCWEWQGSRHPKGYAQITGRGQCGRRAHRVYYEALVGPIPDGLTLDHLCRNRACVNPEHLEPVSVGENTRRGATTKLTAERVDTIRRSTFSSEQLAAAYGVSQSQIDRVRAGTSWREAA